MVSVSNITRLLPENSANNTSVFLEINDPLIPLADVNVVLEGNFDLDGDGINTFTDPIFNFAQQAWEIRVADRDLIDFETLDSFSLTVRASDGTSRDSGTLSIPLSDVNEAPILDDATFQALDATTIETGLISSVTASDPENNSLSYEIIDGNDPDANGRGAFRIDRGAITLVNPEELTQEYNLTVAVSDSAGLQDTATVTIPVFAAPFVESRELTLDENSAEGTVISLGSDLIQDANTNLADLRVTLTSGNQDSDGDGNFAFSSPIFNPDTEAWELIVNDTDELNFEENESFALELQASDGTRADVGFPTIALNDLNEAPVIRDQTFNELNGNNASEFQLVGNVDAFDPDSGQEPPNLAITGGNDPDGNDISAFRVEDGQIQVANPGELSQDFTLTITATDTEDSNLTDSAEITIPIVAAPIVASNTIELPENSENDTAIALDIRDANTPLGDLNVTLNSGNPDNDDDGIKAFSAPTFNEEAGQWELLVTDSDELNFEFEENNSFPLRIQASDGEQSDTSFPTIALTDVNEAPELTVPEFEQPIDANQIVEEFEQAQAQAEAAEEEIELPVVGAITEIKDPDFEQSVSTLAITGGNDPDGNETNAFIINEFNELVVINPQELTQDFTLSITATDDSEDALTSN
ncbi:cadherin repeat domain-containing protein [Dactylococcopsis salina]|uniref:Cadherin domain-containing protein n=1 Tax=Dactylococcopsis salina (strain PCC 8305) TaxID=13035 RepID=K9YRY9_DACS8|nr:cadherin repeat domain-containing protein [Dactylococcopsis salina]AFZ49130.1 hypothetical protein Dacsa_0328 [Dactylococcopsis salina PCC 8305]